MDGHDDGRQRGISHLHAAQMDTSAGLTGGYSVPLVRQAHKTQLQRFTRNLEPVLDGITEPHPLRIHGMTTQAVAARKKSRRFERDTKSIMVIIDLLRLHAIVVRCHAVYGRPVRADYSYQSDGSTPVG